MADVSDIAVARMRRGTHTEGDAKCLRCKHEWHAIIPSADISEWLECPECGLSFGAFKYPVYKDEHEHWECGCGNDLFYMTPSGMYCPACGHWQEGWKD